jgi:hypothetical protein
MTQSSEFEALFESYQYPDDGSESKLPSNVMYGARDCSLANLTLEQARACLDLLARMKALDTRDPGIFDQIVERFNLSPLGQEGLRQALPLVLELCRETKYLNAMKELRNNGGLMLREAKDAVELIIKPALAKIASPEPPPA